MVLGRQGSAIGKEVEALEAELFAAREVSSSQTKRWTTNISPKVNSPSVICFESLCGANVVTLPADIKGNEMFLVHRVARVGGP